MRVPIAKMSRKQLLTELPKRMVVLTAFLSVLGLLLGGLAAIAIQSDYNPVWLAVLAAAILSSPIAFARVSRWTLKPAEERAKRRREAMDKALREWSFPGGDSQV